MNAECEMIPLIKEVVRNNGYDLVVEEVPAGSGIADIVGIETDKKEFLERIRYNCYSPRNITDFEILSRCDGQWLTTKEIAYLVGRDTRTIKRNHLDHMTPYYFDIKKEGNTYLFRKIREYNPITKRAVAIEAKMRDWKRALRQAIRYKSVANYAYIALLEPTRESISFELLKNKKIGLILVTEDSAYEELAAGVSERCSEGNLIYIGEIVWNLYVKRVSTKVLQTPK